MWRWSDSLNFLRAGDFGSTRPLSVSAFPQVDSSMAFERRDDRADCGRDTVNRAGRRRWKRSSAALSAAASTTSIERMAWAFIGLRGTKNFDDFCWVAALRLQSLPETAKICRKNKNNNFYPDRVFILSKFSSTPVTMLIFAKRFARIFLRLHQLQIDGKTVTIATESVDFMDLTDTNPENNWYPVAIVTVFPSICNWWSRRNIGAKRFANINIVTGVLENFERIKTMVNERSVDGAKKRKWRKTKDFHSLVAGGDT